MLDRLVRRVAANYQLSSDDLTDLLQETRIARSHDAGWRRPGDSCRDQQSNRSAVFLQTFVEYPPSQRPASFSVDGVRRQVDKKIDESFKKRGIEP